MTKFAPSLLVAVLAVVLPLAQLIAAQPPTSGLRPGDEVEPWNPIHIAGPDRGTNNCPVCTYLEKPVVVAFVKDTPNTVELVARLEGLAREYRKTGLRIVVAVTDAGPERVKELANKLMIADVALCCMSAKTGAKELKAYKIDPAAENTVILYKNYLVTASFVNVSAKGSGPLADAVKKLLP